MFSFVTLSSHCMYAHTHKNSYFTISNLFLLLYSYRITESKPYLLGGLPSIQFSHSVMSDSVTPQTAACQVSLSITNSQSSLKLMSLESAMPSSHLILCHPLLLLHSIFPSNRVFSKESVLHIRWPKYWSSSYSISPSNEYSATDFLYN